MTEYLATCEVKGSGARNYCSGKYELKDKNGQITILYLKKNQVRFMDRAFIRLGFTSFGCLEHIHQSDLPKWERI